MPEPRDQEDGTSIRFFLVSGLRHVDEADPDRVSALVASLKTGHELSWSAEKDNPVNDRALRIEADGQQVGWMPDYLLDDVNKTSTAQVKIFVEHANGPDTPWHLRLLCRMESRTIAGT